MHTTKNQSKPARNNLADGVLPVADARIYPASSLSLHVRRFVNKAFDSFQATALNPSNQVHYFCGVNFEKALSEFRLSYLPPNAKRDLYTQILASDRVSVLEIANQQLGLIPTALHLSIRKLSPPISIENIYLKRVTDWIAQRLIPDFSWQAGKTINSEDLAELLNIENYKAKQILNKLYNDGHLSVARQSDSPTQAYEHTDKLYDSDLVSEPTKAKFARIEKSKPKLQHISVDPSVEKLAQQPPPPEPINSKERARLNREIHSETLVDAHLITKSVLNYDILGSLSLREVHDRIRATPGNLDPFQFILGTKSRLNNLIDSGEVKTFVIAGKTHYYLAPKRKLTTVALEVGDGPAQAQTGKDVIATPEPTANELTGDKKAGLPKIPKEIKDKVLKQAIAEGSLEYPPQGQQYLNKMDPLIQKMLAFLKENPNDPQPRGTIAKHLEIQNHEKACSTLAQACKLLEEEGVKEVKKNGRKMYVYRTSEFFSKKNK